MGVGEAHMHKGRWGLAGELDIFGVRSVSADGERGCGEGDGKRSLCKVFIVRRWWWMSEPEPWKEISSDGVPVFAR